jgi:cbb3-type cytochrome oxidase cytochrome c subunit
MPQFQFARVRRLKGESDAAFKARTDKEEAEAREAVMTFVLGLVGEPTPLKYINNPKPERAAEVVGRQVLDKYNCAGCHQVRPGVYEFKMTPEVQARLYDTFYKNAIDESQIAAWLKDHVYQNHTAWFGPAPTSDRLTAFGYFNKAETEKSTAGDVIEITEALRFYGPDRAAHDLRAGMYVTLPKGSYEAHEPYGGTFADLLIPYLNKKDATNFPPAEPGKARSVLPPPLVREGERVQPDWLYRFLLNPGEIRPQNYMLLRMPKFNMSPEEARALVNYFAAVAKLTNPGAGVTYPYVAIPQRDSEYWKDVQDRYLVTAKARLADAEKALKDNKDKAKEAALQKVVDGLKDRLNPPADAKGAAKDPYSRSAFQLLTDKNLCISCHNIGSVTGKDPPKGPNLALAGERLRPEWSEHWIANPRRMFTYSPLMPQNFPNAPSPVEWQYQDLFAGSPLQQVRAARDLIMDTGRLQELAPTYKPPPEEKTEDKKK